MKQFVGIKRLLATPMNRAEYNEYRGWELPGDEDGNDEGYLVEYPGGGQNVPGHDGYVSWSPAQQFHDAYEPIGSLSFSSALFMLRQGFRIAREGWNGKGMWLIMVPGSYVETKNGTPYNDAGLDEVKIDAHIDMLTAQGTMQPGWLASQADMLADDWVVL